MKDWPREPPSTTHILLPRGFTFSVTELRPGCHTDIETERARKNERERERERERQREGGRERERERTRAGENEREREREKERTREREREQRDVYMEPEVVFQCISRAEKLGRTERPATYLS